MQLRTFDESMIHGYCEHKQVSPFRISRNISRNRVKHRRTIDCILEDAQTIIFLKDTQMEKVENDIKYPDGMKWSSRLVVQF